MLSQVISKYFFETEKFACPRPAELYGVEDVYFVNVTYASPKSSGPEIQRPQVRILREVNFSQCLFLAVVVLTFLCGCRSGNL